MIVFGVAVWLVCRVVDVGVMFVRDGTSTLMSLRCFFFLMIRRPPRSTLDRSSAASDVYKRQDSTILFSFKIHALPFMGVFDDWGYCLSQGD